MKRYKPTLASLRKRREYMEVNGFVRRYRNRRRAWVHGDIHFGALDLLPGSVSAQVVKNIIKGIVKGNGAFIGVDMSTMHDFTGNYKPSVRKEGPYEYERTYTPK